MMGRTMNMKTTLFAVILIVGISLVPLGAADHPSQPPEDDCRRMAEGSLLGVSAGGCYQYEPDCSGGACTWDRDSYCDVYVDTNSGGQCLTDGIGIIAA